MENLDRARRIKRLTPTLARLVAAHRPNIKTNAEGASDNLQLSNMVPERRSPRIARTCPGFSRFLKLPFRAWESEFRAGVRHFARSLAGPAGASEWIGRLREMGLNPPHGAKVSPGPADSPIRSISRANNGRKVYMRCFALSHRRGTAANRLSADSG